MDSPAAPAGLTCILPTTPERAASAQSLPRLLIAQMSACLPLQPHSYRLGLDLGKPLNLPESTPCPTSFSLPAIPAPSAPNSLSQPTIPPSTRLPSAISLDRCLFLQEAFPFPRLSSLSSCGCRQPLSIPYLTTYHCGTTAHHELWDHWNLCCPPSYQQALLNLSSVIMTV